MFYCPALPSPTAAHEDPALSGDEPVTPEAPPAIRSAAPAPSLAAPAPLSAPIRKQHALLVEHFSKTYEGTQAVTDLSFAAEPGEILGLVGPNGAGKTTTLRSIS